MIEVTNLTRKYGDAFAIENLNFTIEKGKVYGFLGPNGAGKSTFMRLLAGVYRPESGSITVDGAPVWENPEVKSRILFVPDELCFLPQSSSLSQRAGS